MPERDGGICCSSGSEGHCYAPTFDKHTAHTVAKLKLWQICYRQCLPLFAKQIEGVRAPRG